MADESNAVHRVWWVVASDRERPGKAPSRWEWWFPQQGAALDKDWGRDFEGPNWIQDRRSYKRIQGMHAGDVIMAYQAAEGIVGLACLDSDGYQSAGDGAYDTFDLKTSPTVWLQHPVPISVIRREPGSNQDHVEFLRQGARGTVFCVTTQGFGVILQCIRRLNPDQDRDIRSFLAHSARRSTMVVL